MSYAVEWMPGVVVLWTVLLLLVIPEFALIAVLALALAALVALVALAAAALVSPYLLVRSVRRRVAQRTIARRGQRIDSPSVSPIRSNG
jgi:membrane protein implicated in regulation of membrane protease activity